MAMKFVVLSALVALSSATAVVPAPELTNLWYHVGEARESDSINVLFSLKQQNLDKLEEYANIVSDPRSPSYKEYWTAAQVADLTRPNPESVQAVKQFLGTADEVSVSEDEGVVRARFSVAEASRVFSTTFRRVAHPSSARVFTIARDYVLPEEVKAATSAVFGMHGLPAVQFGQDKIGQMPSIPPVTPSLIEKVYQITAKHASGSMKNKQAVAEFQGQLMNTSDLSAFFKEYVPNAQPGDDTVNQFFGGIQNGEGIEALLDIEYIMGVAPGIKTDFYEQLNMDFCSDLKNWTTLLLSQASAGTVPNVHSISYGWQGNLTQIGCTMENMQAVDTDFQKLATMGITIIFASGDSGSGYAPPMPPQPPQCNREAPGTKNVARSGDILRNLTITTPPDEGAWLCCQIAGEIGAQEGYAGWTYTPEGGKCTGNECHGMCVVLKTITTTGPKTGSVSAKGLKPPPPPPHPKLSLLYPSWPASSNYVTAVGATRFHEDKTTNPEAAVNQEDHFGSGGGFSPWTEFTQGTWQAAAVKGYFQNVDPSTLPDPTKVSYNKMGRATPDVSALGTAFQVISGGKPLPGGVGGTSASAPTFAAIVSLVNEELINAGKKPMGYLNPFIYQNAQAFTDVTIGSNKIGRGGPILPYGFNCTKGWDPVTGMGTPIYTELIKAAMATGK